MYLFLYKAEFVGVGMTSLNSKVYHVWSVIRGKGARFVTKTSCTTTNIQDSAKACIKIGHLMALEDTWFRSRSPLLDIVHPQ